jgi:hypothetical protein
MSTRKPKQQTETTTTNSKEKEEIKLCKQCKEEVPRGRGSDFCSSECEIAYLKGLVLNQNERLDSFARKSHPPVCISRAEFARSVQELYTSKSYGAKRRAVQLRKLGFECAAIGAGKLVDSEGSELRVAALNIVKREQDGEYVSPPRPESFDPKLLQLLTVIGL